MKQIATTLTAGLTALTILATATATPAQAGKKGRWIAAGIATGIVATAIIVESKKRKRSSWQRHVDRCYDRYDSYDHRSDTYIDHRGRERRCRL